MILVEPRAFEAVRRAAVEGRLSPREAANALARLRAQRAAGIDPPTILPVARVRLRAWWRDRSVSPRDVAVWSGVVIALGVGVLRALGW